MPEPGGSYRRAISYGDERAAMSGAPENRRVDGRDGAQAGHGSVQRRRCMGQSMGWGWGTDRDMGRGIG
ncbi:hypothetical protein GOB93_02500 [Acetobacter musti]|uniref:Uncharacterized protein n=1 Tax=Acetobacter musti TaxID=864732 RepID=A0ABX0JL65_9PROT|nr:hypothetical protein [Acetobacter musti]NHN83509.1 hypothetical protein [Acetobacter musti]